MVNLSECTANFTTEKHYDYPDRIQNIIVTMTHPSLGELATAHCLLIRSRSWFKNAGDFLEIMDEVSQEMQEFAVGLFDKYSNVRPWLVDGGSKSGSACWGKELSTGNILYIEEVNVVREVRFSLSLLPFLFYLTWISSSGDMVSARGSSRKYYWLLIWETKGMRTVGRHQLVLRLARLNGRKNRLPSQLSIVK